MTFVSVHRIFSVGCFALILGLPGIALAAADSTDSVAAADVVYRNGFIYSA